jgi:hypothetical protein
MAYLLINSFVQNQKIQYTIYAIPTINGLSVINNAISIGKNTPNVMGDINNQKNEKNFFM